MMKGGAVQLVFIPMPEVGHLASMVELAQRLIDLNNSLTITVLTPTVPFSAIAPPRAMSSPNLNFLDLPYLDSPELHQVSGVACYSLLAKLLKPHVKHALLTNHQLHKVNGLVFDFSFIVPMMEVATDIGVPPFVYFPSNAAMLGLLFHLSSLDESSSPLGHGELSLPGFSGPVPLAVLPSFMWEGYDAEGYTCMINNAKRITQLKGIIVNTLPELEPGAKELVSSAAPTTIYAVGPVLDLDGRALSKATDHDDQVVEWLDGQPEGSVVFLCFGSRGAFGPAQVREIAYGLEHSGHSFLWSLRKPPTAAHDTPRDYWDTKEVLPEGFLERTAGRGLVCGWVPQGRVLEHVAIGGFVSHCGWNSVLESIWCGVPILGWPIYAEQKLNAYLLVKELGAGHAIIKGGNNFFFEGGCDLLEAYTDGGDLVMKEQVEDGINRVMEVDSLVRKKVKDLSIQIKKAVNTNTHGHGSSSISLSKLLQNLSVPPTPS